MQRVIVVIVGAVLVGSGFAVGGSPASGYCDPEVGPCTGQYVDTAVCTAQKAVKETKRFFDTVGDCFIHPT